MNRRGYTLVEMMVATALTLVIMVAVVNGFGFIGDKITNARAALEMSEELRGASARLIADLENVTAPMTPPLSPGAGQGYFEITEGPGMTAVDSEISGNPVDTTVGDLDDYVMFTTRSRSAPFVGRNELAAAGATVESHEAEVAWFVRGRTLYRRVLLVAPNAAVSGNGTGFYAGNDISVRRDNASGTIYANTLADLTRPENRFAHQPYHWYSTSGWNAGYPYHPHFCMSYDSPVSVFATVWASLRNTSVTNRGCGLGLPTLAECSSPNWVAGGVLRTGPTPPTNAPGATPPYPKWGLSSPATVDFDAWRQPYPWTELSQSIGSLKHYCDPEASPAVTTPRMNEDIILNNVLSFDVKVWDPTAPLRQVGTEPVLAPGDPGYDPTAGTVVARGAYVDLNYANNNAYSVFSGPGINAGSAIAAVYDTWSTHYESNGIDENLNGTADQGQDGFDNGGLSGVVDDPGEQEAPPPYSAQLRGVQIKIRTYEPSTRQIREVTVVHNFVSK